VLQLAAVGEGEVVADNSETIGTLLQAYNDGIPSPSGASQGGGACSLSGAGAVESAPWLPLSWVGLLGACVGRRRARRARQDV
jgi:hypothetical protein